ncbi:MAG: methyltransferase type 11 [Blastopirellula sp.]|nr:MAG: methyltransferase type 11 [Blastopirellula sp.]
MTQPNSPEEKSTTIAGNLYDYPSYYDVIFGADWRREIELLKFCFEQHTELEVKQLFEPACGTGRLLIQLAKLDFEVTGLDLNPRAVKYCNQRFKRAGRTEAAVCGDMTDFSLSDLTLQKPMQAAFNPINSIRHLLSEDQMQSHWQCMAEVIELGGLYIVGLHLSPEVGTPCDAESWTASRGQLTVCSHLQTTDLDLTERIERVAMSYDVTTPGQKLRIDGELIFRTYSLEQFTQSFENSANWKLCAVYDFTYDTSQQISLTEASEDVIFVLQRT